MLKTLLGLKGSALMCDEPYTSNLHPIAGRYKHLVARSLRTAT
jgi:hypothetical protein